MIGKVQVVTNGPSREDLAASHELLVRLSADVDRCLGTLAAGEARHVSQQALRELVETRIAFGNPSDRLVRLTPNLYKSLGLSADPIQRMQLNGGLHFYHIAVSVSVLTSSTPKFSELGCHLAFSPKGEMEPIIQTLIPTSAWRERVLGGAQAEIGVNADESASIALSLLADAVGLPVPAAVALTAEQRAHLSAFVRLPDISLVQRSPEVLATGTGNSECAWTIKQPDLLRQLDTTFVVIFKCPKELKDIHLSGVAYVRPSIGWLEDKLASVAELLSAPFKTLLSKGESGRTEAEALPIGIGEHWVLKLPTP